MANNDLVEEALTTPANDPLANMGNMDGDIFDDDFEPPAPSAYPLGSNAGRCGFLEAYIWRGEDALWESVNHIWHQLAEPKALRCTMIGSAAGTGGTGKKALIPFLRRALRHTLDNDIPQPWDADYPDIHAFHEAATAYFAADHQHYEKMIQKYADFLNGGAEEDAPGQAVIIEGPWKPVLPDPGVLAPPHARPSATSYV